MAPHDDSRMASPPAGTARPHSALKGGLLGKLGLDAAAAFVASRSPGRWAAAFVGPPGVLSLFLSLAGIALAAFGQDAEGGACLAAGAFLLAVERASLARGSGGRAEEGVTAYRYLSVAATSVLVVAWPDRLWAGWIIAYAAVVLEYGAAAGSFPSDLPHAHLSRLLPVLPEASA